MKIIYEPHPVTPERKAELREQGFKIIDAAFEPPKVESGKDQTKEPAAPKGKTKTAQTKVESGKAE
jgi:hypothetical protein